jgi:hypothetical protein
MSQMQTTKAGERTQRSAYGFSQGQARSRSVSPIIQEKAKFPPPAKRRSLKRMIQKLLAERDFAQFIHEEVVKARMGDRAAGARVAAHFKPLPTELASLSLNGSQYESVNMCTVPTTLMLIDFAAPHLR